MRANGMIVTVAEHGSRRPLGVAVDLCCYRVIQEALTNAARHAPGAPVTVTVDYRDAEVALTIADRGASVPRIESTTNAGGFGLIGMHERVSALGGDVTAACLDIGFRVTARVPAPTPEQAS
jgi:signal transduction histidine kinase